MTGLRGRRWAVLAVAATVGLVVTLGWGIPTFGGPLVVRVEAVVRPVPGAPGSGLGLRLRDGTVVGSGRLAVDLELHNPYPLPVQLAFAGSAFRLELRPGGSAGGAVWTYAEADPVVEQDDESPGGAGDRVALVEPGTTVVRLAGGGPLIDTAAISAIAAGTYVLAASAYDRPAAAIPIDVVASVAAGPTASPGSTPAPTAVASATLGPTAEPTPGATPGSTGAPLTTRTPDPQPSFPIRAAFYYPWFPEAWNQQGYDPYTWYRPALGYYATTAVIGRQVAAMQAAGIEAGIASWWGQGSATDRRIPTLLAHAGSFRWSLYYEPEGQGNPTVARIRSDLAYIVGHYGHAPGFLRVGGRPVVFVYADPTDGCGMVDRWTEANASIHAYIVLKVFSGYRQCAHQPDSWHQYAPAMAADDQAGYSYSISPGFWLRSDPIPRLPRDLARWRRDVAAMVASGEPWQLITTFNEWGEGTMVEDSTQFGSSYLAALAGH